MAKVLYFGDAPGYSGCFQVNFLAPAGVTGAVPGALKLFGTAGQSHHDRSAMMPTRRRLTVLTFCCFAASAQQYSVSTIARGAHLLLSTPAAQTWKPLNQGLPKEVSGVSQIAVSTDGTMAYAVSSLGGLLRKSQQSGRWKQLDGVVGVSALALAAGPNPMVYAATNAGIRVSSDKGKTWKNAGSANASVAGIQSIAVDPGDAETAYTVANAPEASPGVLAGSQVLKTTDGGETWAAISSFSSQDGVTTVSLDPVNPSTLYASSFSGGIFKTVDGGRTWIAIKAGLIDTGFGDVVRLVVDPKNPSTLYAGSFVAFIDPGGPDQPGFGTVSKSSDGGQTWTTIRSGIPAGTFVDPPAMDPANSLVLYAGFEGQGNDGGVLKSTDGGESWSQVYATSGVGVNVSAGSGILYAAQETSGGGAGGIAASTNGGQNWTASNQGLGYFDLKTLVLDPYDPDEVYAGGSLNQVNVIVPGNVSGAASVLLTYLERASNTVTANVQ
jgi:photosystem II stability/assembly factor-like uncharacterized protein